MPQIIVSVKDLDDGRSTVGDDMLDRLEKAIRDNADTGPISVVGPDNAGLDLLGVATSMAPSLLRDLRRARGVIRMLEWSNNGKCPECKTSGDRGHDRYCVLAAVLGR